MKKLTFTIAACFILLFGNIGCKNQVDPIIYSEERTTIEYKAAGTSGKAIVFIHGWSCDKSYWDLQIPYFSEKYRVVAIDLPGHGDSQYDRDEWTMEAFGKDVAAVVEGLDLQEVVLVGHSMGGSVILAAAQVLGDKVVGLVGVDTFQDLETVYPEEQLNAYIKPFEENFVETTKGFVRSMFPPTADSLLVERIAFDMSSAPEDVALGSFRGLFDFKPIPVLEQIKTPIYGINSDMYPVNIEAGKRHITRFNIRFMEGYGHFLHQEDPDQFNRILDEILKEIFEE